MTGRFLAVVVLLAGAGCHGAPAADHTAGISAHAGTSSYTAEQGTNLNGWAIGGTAGPGFSNNGGALEAHNPLAGGLGIVRGLTPVGTTDLATKAYVDGKTGSSISGTGWWYSAGSSLQTTAVALGGDVVQGSLGGGVVPLTVEGIDNLSIVPLEVGCLYYSGSAFAWVPCGSSGDGGTSDAGANGITQLTTDVLATGPGEVAATVVGIHTRSISSSSPSSGNAYYWSGSTWAPGPLNLAGGSNYVENLLPVTNVAHGTAGEILITNGTPTSAWVAMSGDSQISSSGLVTNVGLQNSPLPTLDGGAGTGCLDWTGSAWQFAVCGGGGGDGGGGVSPPNLTGFWFNSSSATLDGNAVTLTGDVSQQPISGNNVPLNVTGLHLTSQAQGDIAYYNGSAWVILAPGTSGDFLETHGASANPTWAAVSGGSGITQLTGDVLATGPGVVASTIDNISGTGSPAIATISAAELEYTQGAGTGGDVIITQAQQANGAVPNSIELKPQAPGSSPSSASDGTPGSLVVALAAPTGSGSQAAFTVDSASSAIFDVRLVTGTAYVTESLAGHNAVEAVGTGLSIATGFSTTGVLTPLTVLGSIVGGSATTADQTTINGSGISFGSGISNPTVVQAVGSGAGDVVIYGGQPGAPGSAGGTTLLQGGQAGSGGATGPVEVATYDGSESLVLSPSSIVGTAGGSEAFQFTASQGYILTPLQVDGALVAGSGSSTTQTTINTSGITFGGSISDPTITQAIVANASGNVLAIYGQPSNGSGNAGGQVSIFGGAPGAGGTAGGVIVSSSDANAYFAPGFNGTASTLADGYATVYAQNAIALNSPGGLEYESNATTPVFVAAPTIFESFVPMMAETGTGGTNEVSINLAIAPQGNANSQAQEIYATENGFLRTTTSTPTTIYTLAVPLGTGVYGMFDLVCRVVTNSGGFSAGNFFGETLNFGAKNVSGTVTAYSGAVGSAIGDAIMFATVITFVPSGSNVLFQVQNVAATVDCTATLHDVTIN
jgi:hypothetical protein